MSATKFLLDLISSELKDILRQKMSETNPFIVIWMYLVGVVTSTLVEKRDVIKIKLKALAPSQYAGKDVFLLGHDYMTHGETLDAAGQFDLTLMLSMVDGFLLMGVTSHHIELVYRHPLRDLHNKLDMVLREVIHGEAGCGTCQNLTFQEVCTKFAEDCYQKLKDTGQWPPAQHTPNSNAVATPFTSLLDNAQPVTLGNLTQPQFLVLVQAGFASGGCKGHACHNCGKEGHWVNCCLKKKRKPHGPKPDAKADKKW
jgi:hypothetical protein